jgi:hypothetical protein
LADQNRPTRSVSARLCKTLITDQPVKWILGALTANLKAHLNRGGMCMELIISLLSGAVGGLIKNMMSKA